MKERRDYRQLKVISSATVLEEAHHIKLIWLAILVLAILLFSLIIWASFATIKETAVTYGEIIPEGKIQVVQHLEAGVVAKVLVKDGQSVQKDQLLLTFNDVAAKSELKQLQSKEITLILAAERIRAYLNNKDADLLKWSSEVINSKYNTVENREKIERLLHDEKELLNSQSKSRDYQISILQTSIERREEKLKQAEQEKEVLQKHIILLLKEFKMYQKLKENNYVSHKDYLVILRDLNRARGEDVKLVSEIQQTKQEIIEEQNKLRELQSALREKSMKELVEMTDDLLEARHKIEKLEDTLQRINVLSPVAGIVKGLQVASGNVTQPGGLLLEVVPFNQPYLVESRVNPRDIGHIKVGDPVTVKLLTYDFARYGSIKGKLTKISASTFIDSATNKPYYTATTTLDQQFLGGKSNARPLMAGMTVEASIITGEKTLLEYLLKPIHRSTDHAFRER